ncbi:DUF6344 domain-containing protein [Streptomyces sp. NPDC086023]|uniref:DUF6344 domain-containing protein n=1 Tax=Streptomyces sp. NPDC086023 TaxID=3365746 RepID=UPI0037CD8C9C
MTSSRATSFWTAFFAAVAAVLLGLFRGRSRGAEAAAVAPAPAARVAAGVPSVRVPSSRRSRRSRAGRTALPPTIKQRIRAEAHGASPAVRRSSSGVSSDAERYELTA